MTKILLTLFLILAFVSCAPKVEEEKTSLSLKMPKSDRSKRSSNRYSNRNVPSTGTFGLANISSLDDIDCYMVAIAYSKAEVSAINSGTCGNETDEVNNIHIASATVADGGEIVIDDVPVGPARSFYVIGFSHTSSGSACPDFKSIQPSQYANISKPVLVGQKSQALLAQAENIVDVTVSMGGAIQLNGCRNTPFSWVIGGVFDESKFGNAVFGP